MDAQTLGIWAIEVTDNRVGEAPILPHLLDQIAHDAALASVTADGAYDTKACHAAIAGRGAAAVIPAMQECASLQEAGQGLLEGR